MPTVREITVNELSDLIAKHEDLTIVDVREREQYAKGHIPGALSVPLGSIEHAANVTSVACNHQLVRARADTVVTCCDDERRSRVAATLLDRVGFLTVYFLAGGLTRWQAEGFPLVSG